MKPQRLGINVDHVATLRNARGEHYPDPVQAALLVLCWLMDRWLLLPDERLAWMASLRLLLTCVAVACLGVAGLS